MTGKCNWIAFQAHPGIFVKSEDDHPEFFGVFACPVARPDPDALLKEILDNRKISLVEITDRRLMDPARDWGMNERLKTQMDEQGYGLSLTKLHARSMPVD